MREEEKEFDIAALARAQEEHDRLELEKKRAEEETAKRRAQAAETLEERKKLLSEYHKKGKEFKEGGFDEARLAQMQEEVSRYESVIADEQLLVDQAKSRLDERLSGLEVIKDIIARTKTTVIDSVAQALKGAEEYARQAGEEWTKAFHKVEQTKSKAIETRERYETYGRLFEEIRGLGAKIDELSGIPEVAEALEKLAVEEHLTREEFIKRATDLLIDQETGTLRNPARRKFVEEVVNKFISCDFTYRRVALRQPRVQTKIDEWKAFRRAEPLKSPESLLQEAQEKAEADER